MATLVGIRGWAAPILRQEQRQSTLRWSQVVRLRVQRQQHGIGAHAHVELLGQSIEECETAGAIEYGDTDLARDAVVRRIIRRRWRGVAHVNCGSSQSGKMSGSSRETESAKRAWRFSKKLDTPSCASALRPRI